jgi:hypothetical protein
MRRLALFRGGVLHGGLLPQGETKGALQNGVVDVRGRIHGEEKEPSLLGLIWILGA